MKCPHCSSEWTVSLQVKGDVKRCPFCGNNLDSSNYQKMDTLEAVLVQIVTDQGLDALFDGHRMIGLFTDLAPNMKRESRILKYFVDAEGHKKLNNARNAAPADQRSSMERTVQKMTDEFAVAEDAARLVCEAYWVALTGKPMRWENTKNRLLPTKSGNEQWRYATKRGAFRKESQVKQREAAVYTNAQKMPGVIMVVTLICFVILGFAYNISRSVQTKNHDAIYQEAEALFTAGDYEGLIIYLSNQENDMLEYDDIRLFYDKASGRYKEDILSLISTYVESEQYAEAIELIDNLIPQIRDDSQIKDIKLNITDQYTNYIHAQTVTFPDEAAWSEWGALFPESISLDSYEIETKTQYRSRTRETTTFSKSSMDGWSLYDTKSTWGEWSGWSDWNTNEVSSNDSTKVETKTKYRFADKVTTTSTSSSLDGWTQYDSSTSWSDWGSWSGWSTNVVSASDSRQVETAQRYRYYSFSCSQCGARIPYKSGSSYGKCYTELGGCGSTNYSYGYHEILLANPPSDATLWAYNKRCLIVDGIRWYINTGDAPVTAYRYRDRTQITTYYYWKWDAWSNWSDEVYSESDSRKIETRTMYRYCTRSLVYTYYFERYSAWSSWSDSAITESGSVDVETRKLYRYRKK